MPASPFSQADCNAVYRVIEQRHDVRRGFLPLPMTDGVFSRILASAHHAPSVGLMQPWRLILIRDHATRVAVHTLFTRASREAAEWYTGEQRNKYDSLKLEGSSKPLKAYVVFDPDTDRGTASVARLCPTALYSVTCAVQNLWLAARAEGTGVGWVSILDPEHLRGVLGIPQHIVPVAYLYLGYVESFASEPDLQLSGWKGAFLLAACCRSTAMTRHGLRTTRTRDPGAIMILGTRSHVGKRLLKQDPAVF